MEANLRMEFNDTIDDDIFGSITLGKLNDMYLKWLEEEVRKLRSQLTWRDVSANPEKGGDYLCKILDDNYPREADAIVTFVDSYSISRGEYNGWTLGSGKKVVKWLPIPKEQS